jgi:hypothetical protein
MATSETEIPVLDPSPRREAYVNNIKALFGLGYPVRVTDDRLNYYGITLEELAVEAGAQQVEGGDPEHGVYLLRPAGE